MYCYYLVKYRTMIDEHEGIDSAVIFAFDRELPRDQKVDKRLPFHNEQGAKALASYFENLYPDFECDRDEVVCFYKNGEIAVQYDPYLHPMPVEVAEWHRDNHTLVIVKP